jgi:hypothetical protein
VEDLLFNSGNLRLALEAQAEKMRAAVEAEPEESLKQADADEWAAALAHHFAVACPELQPDEVWMEPVKDVKVDVSWDRSRYFSDPYSDLARNFPAIGSSFTSRSKAKPMSSSCGRVRSRSTLRGARTRIRLETGDFRVWNPSFETPHPSMTSRQGYSQIVHMVSCRPGPAFVAWEMPYTSEAEVRAGVASGKLTCKLALLRLSPIVGG